MVGSRREKKFLEAVKQSGLVPAVDLDRALGFQKFAATRGKEIPLDRILLKFELLDRDQIAKLYLALRFFTWRKEDKLYVKIAVQSQLLAHEYAKRCLKEQKRAFKEHGELKRVNRIALEKNFLSAKEDRAIVTALKKMKPRLTLVPLDGNPLFSGELASPLRKTANPDALPKVVAPLPSPGLGDSSSIRRGPAKKGEEEQWRKDVRARELAELSHAADGGAPDGVEEVKFADDGSPGGPKPRSEGDLVALDDLAEDRPPAPSSSRGPSESNLVTFDDDDPPASTSAPDAKAPSGGDLIPLDEDDLSPPSRGGKAQSAGDLFPVDGEERLDRRPRPLARGHQDSSGPDDLDSGSSVNLDDDTDGEEGGDEDFGDPVSRAQGLPEEDEDLDPLWAEADLDAIELDSGQLDDEPRRKPGKPGRKGPAQASGPGDEDDYTF